MIENKSQENDRILIVDDMPRNIQVLGTILRRKNYMINVAENGEKALEMVQKIKPDLILLDVMMPVMDGFETCIALKKVPDYSDIPIIFLTARAETDSIVKGFELGAVDYVTKPFNMLELLTRVEHHLTFKKYQEKLQQQSKEMKELVHIMCHDLGNPIGSIRELANLMMNNDAKPNREMIECIQLSSANAMDLILLVRKLRTLDEYQLELEMLDLKEVFSTTLQLVDNRLKDKNITIETDIPDNLSIRAEQTSLINSVLMNLLTNAIKFSHPGSMIEVAGNKGTDGVELSITDYGIGIPEMILKNIYDFRISTSRNGTSGEMGTGFGMPLVQKFMMAYGGDIHITSVCKKNVDPSESNQSADESDSVSGTTVQLIFADKV